MHNLNIIARIIVYSLWVWVFYFDGLHLTLAMRSLVNFIVIADLITWVMYQAYLLPRFVIHFGIGALLNLAVIIFLSKAFRVSCRKQQTCRPWRSWSFFRCPG